MSSGKEIRGAEPAAENQSPLLSLIQFPPPTTFHPPSNTSKAAAGTVPPRKWVSVHTVLPSPEGPPSPVQCWTPALIPDLLPWLLDPPASPKQASLVEQRKEKSLLQTLGAPAGCRIAPSQANSK